MPASEWITTRPFGRRLVQSYGRDLGKWAGGIVRRYVVGVVILVGAVLALLVAVGFGIGAAFHFIELRYGENITFAAFGGIFALIGLLGVLIGMVLLKRQLPSVPRPRRQIQEFKRSLAVPAAVQVMRDVGQQNVIVSDPVMKILLGAAAALVIGWMASSTFSTSGRVSEE